MEKWENITKAELESLFCEQNNTDSAIAELYGVKKGQVTYKRSKLGVSMKEWNYEQFSSRNGKAYKATNEYSKASLLAKESIDGIAKALTYHVFRNGPVEDMRTDGKLSEEDMKTLNKYMVNQLAGIFTAVSKGNWLQLEMLFCSLKKYGVDWDKAEPNSEDMDAVWEEWLKKLKEIL